jgi:SnoaL-like domain
MREWASRGPRLLEEHATASMSERTPREVFQHHAEALGAEDLEGIVSDYSEDALFITPEGAKRGKDGVREGFRKLLADVPGASWELPTQIYERHPPARVEGEV